MFNKTTPKVSIIIPSWFTENQHGKYSKHETYLIACECMNRLLKVTPKDLYELIIIDNGSSFLQSHFESLFEKDDNSEEYITTSCKNEYKDYTCFYSPDYYFSLADILIRNKENLGFAPAINQGVNMARGEFVVVINNDILLWEGWLEQMLKDFEETLKLDPPVGLLMPALYKVKESFFDTLKRKKEEINMTTNAGKWGLKAEFGSCWMGKRKVLMRIAENRDGYQIMDENFRLGFGEDRWLYQEIRRLNYETYRSHNLRVAHVGNLTIGKVKDRKKYTLKNREYLQELKDKHNIE